MKIGFLIAGHLPDELQADFGNYDRLYAELLQGQGFEFDPYFVVDNDFPEDVHDCDGWLISGSRHGAYEDHDWIPPLEDFIRQAVTEKVPLVGVCFGHQIIAQALGGKVEKFDGGWSVGPTEYDFAGTPLVLNAWHQDQVTEVPPGATVIASTDFCKNAALVYGDRAFSVQPHPEFGNDFVQGLIDARGRGVVPDPVLDGAVSALDKSPANQTIADQIADFFRMERDQ
ncbi:type 1 glutamine amidotransferase [Shimia biformata]|uniref:type 1 glutamine amidotransferase n=1 Tax=Shimia biformata TaxID=1294299 RepID=UPI00194E1CAC|nr:type 1 glutamine amidotransferase [Shimia biformata]